MIIFRNLPDKLKKQTAWLVHMHVNHINFNFQNYLLLKTIIKLIKGWRIFATIATIVTATSQRRTVFHNANQMGIAIIPYLVWVNGHQFCYLNKIICSFLFFLFFSYVFKQQILPVLLNTLIASHSQLAMALRSKHPKPYIQNDPRDEMYNPVSFDFWLLKTCYRWGLPNFFLVTSNRFPLPWT